MRKQLDIFEESLVALPEYNEAHPDREVPMIRIMPTNTAST